MKKLIRLTESDLHRIVKESVKKILRESENPLRPYYDRDDHPLGMGPEVNKNTREEDIYVGKVIQLPLSSVPGVDDVDGNIQLMFKVEQVKKKPSGEFFVAVKAYRDISKDYLELHKYEFMQPDLFGNRPCYGRGSGKTVGIALNIAIKFAVMQIQSSIEHPYKSETPWEWRIP